MEKEATSYNYFIMLNVEQARSYPCFETKKSIGSKNYDFSTNKTAVGVS